MRCTQIIGLPKKAHKFLFENQKTVTCIHCGSVQRIQKVYASAKEYGMFDDGPELLEYTLQDNSVVREVVQAAPWSSGPCIFLKLVDIDGKDRFVWPKKEIDRA